jgi:hypothetical protein
MRSLHLLGQRPLSPPRPEHASRGKTRVGFLLPSRSPEGDNPILAPAVAAGRIGGEPDQPDRRRSESRERRTTQPNTAPTAIAAATPAAT